MEAIVYLHLWLTYMKDKCGKSRLLKSFVEKKKAGNSTIGKLSIVKTILRPSWKLQNVKIN